ncbi:MAG: histidinol-phosphate transaminase [Oscillospiraceae bacterium]|nr:histidinol-phosphate transaminase [Oscillospiraceae bacterium]
MSRFFSEKYATLAPYTPGEQPQNMRYVKLNTNESPFPPSPKALEYAAAHSRPLNLYSDPEQRELTAKLAETLGLGTEQLLLTNGSDEILNFAFMAFCDEAHPAVFPDISYGFYPVFAALNGVPYRTVPLREDFRVGAEDYFEAGGTVFLANPNAPTGLSLSLSEIERILDANPDNVVVIDEAYVDFGGESAVGLLGRYDNLLVTQTFSKSRSLAGGRLGFGAGSPELIRDLNTIKYSTNPYNVNSLTAAVGLGTLLDPEYTRQNCLTIIENRRRLTEALRERGFEVPDSAANFVFARSPRMGGGALYAALKERGVLVRHFDRPARIADYNRITVGTWEQLETLLRAVDEIMEERT